MTLQPYQQASEENINQRTKPLKAAGTIASTGFALASGTGIANRAMALLSPYVPDNLATKGLAKIDSRFGKFIDAAQSMGQPLNVIKDFIKEKISEPAKEERNIIQQYSPELHQFISDQVKSGVSPIKAATMAIRGALGKQFGGAISKLIKDHKISFPELVEQIYGNGQMAQPQQQQPMQGQQAQQGQQGQPQGGIDPGVAQIIQQGQQILSRFKGQQ